MLHKKKLDENAHLATMQMENRPLDRLEIYRSIDANKTGIYFGSDRNIPAWFEVVIYGYSCNKHSVYVRYPDTDFYIEMIGSPGSSHGSITHCHIRSVLEEKLHPFIYEGKLKAANQLILKHDDYAVYKFDSLDFNFLQRVANINDSSNDLDFGYDFVSQMLRRKFIPLPQERTIVYSYLTNENKFIIVDQDAYNFTYEGMRCFYGNLSDGIKLGTMVDFQRYRDGGTTVFNFIINGKVHEFYHPSKLGDNNKDKVPTWDGKEMFEIPPATVDLITQSLKIPIAAEVSYD